jgi:hypothetical protein
MKKTRLLEIIREEIAGALSELTVVDKKTLPTEAPEIAKSENTDINTVKDAIAQAKKSGKPVNIAEEKRKKLAEKYQLDEDTINEMASVVQTKKALEKLVDAGLSPKENLDLVIDVEKETLDQFRKNPRNIDGRLARVLEPDEQPNKQPNKKTGERTRGYGADFEQNFKKKSGVRFDEFTADIEEKFNKAFPDEKKFNSGLATNTTEKDAAAQIFGLEKNKPGPQADPNKPKSEKPTSTGKKGSPTGEPKTKVATRTKGDDGFDDVSYSDVDSEDKEATQNIGSDSTAKELGKEADVSKNPDFDRIRKGLQNKRRNSKDGILSPEDMKLAINIINTAKDKYKFNTTQVDSLRADIGL